MSDVHDRHGRSARWRDEDFDEPGFNGESRRKAQEKKTAQLCAQAHRAVAPVIQNELGELDGFGLWVMEVRPDPDPSRLLVVVGAAPGADLAGAREALMAQRGRARTVLATAIARKRVPQLDFVVVPGGGCDDE